ncbi:MAG: endonuclease V [Sulfuricaulis sp.]|nr:endonuclease V [Sulfuricaulis sp.]
MNLQRPNRWPRRVTEARRVQEKLRANVITRNVFGKIHTVAGIDVGYEKNGKVTRAAVVVLDFPSLTPVDQVVARQLTRFPYVPGYLSFREIPAVLAAMKKLRRRPDLLLCDGQGLAHPRRFGLACHLGLLLDIPSIGVAKSRLTGTNGEVPDTKGAWVPLFDHPSSHPRLNGDVHLLPLSLQRGKGEGDFPHPRAPLPKGEGGEPSALARDLVHSGASRGALHAHLEIIGAVLRTRAGVQPVFVSIGHRISLASAIDYVLRCTTRYRLPETTRSAHRLASTNP